jgi:hypothetical protein
MLVMAKVMGVFKLGNVSLDGTKIEASGRVPKAPQAGPRDKDQVNFTDEKSRIMPSSKGFVQGYNAQAGVDIDSHLIVGNHLTQQANDKQEVAPALERLHELEGSPGTPERCGLFQ